MSKLKTVLIAATVLGGASYAGYTMLGPDSADAEGTRHLVNQVWIDHIPTDQRDMIGHFVIVKHPEGRFGAVGRSSRWRHFIEGLKWKLEGSRLSLKFPQDGKKTAVKARTWKCEGEAPDPFQLCLEVSANGRSRTFYSRKDWVIDVDDVEGSIEALAEDHPALAGLSEAAPQPLPEVEATEADAFEEVDPLSVF